MKRRRPPGNGGKPGESCGSEYSRSACLHGLSSDAWRPQDSSDLGQDAIAPKNRRYRSQSQPTLPRNKSRLLFAVLLLGANDMGPRFLH